jgi:hypothetical protein
MKLMEIRNALLNESGETEGCQVIKPAAKTRKERKHRFYC